MNYDNDAITFEHELEAALDEEMGFFTVLTPGAILEFMNEVQGRINSLDREINANIACFKDADLMDWTEFKLRYAAFYKEHEGFLARMGNAPYYQAERYLKELRGFHERFEAVCGKKPKAAPIVTPSEEDAERVKRMKSLGQTALILGGIAVGGWLLFKFMDR